MPYISEGKPRVTKTDIVAALRELGIEPGDSLFVHSSLSAFGYVDGGAEAVCDALLDAAGPAGTVAVPTFTWGAYHDVEIVMFDTRNDPSGNGAIPETFRQRPDSIRSEHVCHSVAAIGPRAPEVMGEGVRPFAEGSSMYRLHELDFWYLFLGCGFSVCTALHTAEELVHVPYRYYRHFKGSTVIRADGSTVPSKAVEFLLQEPYHNDFGKMEDIFRDRGILRIAHVGNARIVNAKARGIIDIAAGLLRDDAGCLLREESRRYLAAANGAPRVPPPPAAAPTPPPA